MSTKQVKIKSWDVMALEYGLDEDGDIFFKNKYEYFYKYIEDRIPEDRIITIEQDTSDDLWYWVIGIDDEYLIIDEMIEYEIPVNFISTKHTTIKL